MTSVIEINNLEYKDILKNINLCIYDKEFISLIGSSGSGKTTLINSIMGIIEYDGKIYIDGQLLNDDSYKKIGYLNNKLSFISEKVFDIIAFSITNLNYKKSDIVKKVKSISSELKIEHLLNCNINELTYYEKVLVSLASILVYEPKILLFDNAFSKLDRYDRQLILKFIRNKKCSVINISTDSNDFLFSDRIIMMENGKIINNKKSTEIYENEKEFNKIGINLPFIVDLSIKLKYYDLLDKIVYDELEMVNILWK